jgi:hypothetical protein
MSFSIKEDDRSPDFEATLEVSGEPVDLTGTTVKFIMTLMGGTTPKVNAAATVVSATDGTVKYTWGATDTDSPGLYVAEFEVTFAGGVKRTFPPDDYLYVNVVPGLG